MWIQQWRSGQFNVKVEAVVATGKIWLAGITIFVAALVLACERPTPVRVEDVRVTPVTGADIRRAVSDSGAKAVLVNLWATWCGPCREEFPGLVRVAHKYQNQGLKVMLVSADDETDLPAVKKFLAAQGVDFPAYIKAQKDQPFIDALDKRWTGAIPATFIYDGAGRLRDFWEGSVSFTVFEQKVVEALGKRANQTGGNP
jgi:thiol-disulfide isomerase/thioredoxin